MIDFPVPTFIGQKFNSGTGAIYVWDGVAWSLDNSQTRTAKQKNLVVNPSMQVSQENGNTGGTTNIYYTADQWMLVVSGFSFAGQRVQTFVSPDNSLNSVSHWFTAAKPSPAAGDYSQFLQHIEGQRCAELAWGTAKAIPAVLRFNAFCDTPGTYTAAVQSSNSDYSWLGAFTCDGSQNLKTFSFAIPAQPAGTFPKDNTAGLGVRFTYAAGSNFGGGVAGWQAGNKLAVAAQTNGAAATGKGLIITDVGLYPDPLNTGLPPEFIMPTYEDDLARCCRYYEIGNAILQMTTNPNAGMAWKAYKRVPATLSWSFDTGSGATFQNLNSGTGGFYQNMAHSSVGTATIKGSARM